MGIYICFVISFIIAIYLMACHDWGRTLLLNVPLREHNIQITDVIAMFILFYCTGVLVGEYFTGPGGSFTLKSHIMVAVQQVFIALCVLVICYFRFKDGLSGIRITVRPIGKNIIRVFGYSIMVFSFTFFTLTITGFITGPIPQHPFLKELAEKSQPATIVAIFISAAILAPLSEELLFRGLLQSFLVKAFVSLTPAVSTNINANTDSDTDGDTDSNGHTNIDVNADTITDDTIAKQRVSDTAAFSLQSARWKAIFFTAAFFALMHGNWQHWPALFVLACGFGYVYEKYNNLLLAIMMHCLFNSLELVATFLQNHT